MSNVLLTTSVDANGTALVLDTDGVNAIQEVGIVAQATTWGGGTVTLQGSPDGGTTWIAIAGAAFTANGYAVVKVPFPRVRAILSGSTAADTVVATLFGAVTDNTIVAS